MGEVNQNTSARMAEVNFGLIAKILLEVKMVNLYKKIDLSGLVTENIFLPELPVSRNCPEFRFI